MSNKMDVGKQQIVYNYLPGKVFDYRKLYTHALISSIKGNEQNDLKIELILNSINDYVRAWNEDLRPTLKNSVLQTHPERFVLINPRRVESKMFPLIFHCSNPACNRIFNYSNRNFLPSDHTCPKCHIGKLTQLNWIKIHRCGALKALTPPYQCERCHSQNDWALDLRGGTTIQNAVWICRKCNFSTGVRAGYCNECNWTQPINGNSHPKLMDIEPGRSHKTFYPHYVILLNVPTKNIEGFLKLENWPQVAAAIYFELPELNGRGLVDLVRPKGDFFYDIEFFRRAGITITEDQMKKLHDDQSIEPKKIAQLISEKTGLDPLTFIQSSQEMLDSILVLDSKDAKKAIIPEPLRNKMGIFDITLINDFPIIIATFGFSRADTRPNYCRINTFPVDPDLDGKNPIFLDSTQADAIVIRLDPLKVISWLEQNGYSPDIPRGTDDHLLRKAYFCRLFNDVNYRNSITVDNAEARMVFGLLHTLSHLFIRRAALLSGLDNTSITEYVIPRSLTIVIYGNHRFSSSIGALISLFEDSLEELLNNVLDSHHCVYDPVCNRHGSSCHACTQLAETSCRFFNQNLGRSYLFGGNDPILNIDIIGYFDRR
jgi:hypothetical protein